VQEDHDLPHRLLLDRGGENAASTNRPDTVNLAEPIGVVSMMSNTLSPKALTNFLA
jgi:hypothetical protein